MEVLVFSLDLLPIFLLDFPVTSEAQGWRQEWAHCGSGDQRMEKEEGDSLLCILCQQIFAKRLEQMFSHLGYDHVLGVQSSDVGGCSTLTSRIHALFNNCSGNFTKYNKELL